MKLKLNNYIINHPEQITLIDRNNVSNYYIVDCHIHPKGFGNNNLEFNNIIEYLERTGILFATFMGIGQKISLNTPCNYYIECPYVRMYSTFLNDAANVLDFFQYNKRGLPLTGEFKLTKNKLLNPTQKKIHLHIVFIINRFEC